MKERLRKIWHRLRKYLPHSDLWNKMQNVGLHIYSKTVNEQREILYVYIYKYICMYIHVYTWICKKKNRTYVYLPVKLHTDVPGQ